MAHPVAAPSTRTVVLLKPNERKKLDRLAASQHASSGEILRRSLHAYDPDAHTKVEDEELISTMLHEANLALDRALESIRSTRAEIHENLDKMKRVRLGEE